RYAYYTLPVLHSFPTRRSSDLPRFEAAELAAAEVGGEAVGAQIAAGRVHELRRVEVAECIRREVADAAETPVNVLEAAASVVGQDRKSTRLNSSHDQISYAVFC